MEGIQTVQCAPWPRCQNGIVQVSRSHSHLGDEVGVHEHVAGVDGDMEHRGVAEVVEVLLKPSRVQKLNRSVSPFSSAGFGAVNLNFQAISS